MSFFSSFLGTCRGTEIFDRLRGVSFFKALLHLVILSVFCMLLVAGGEYFLNNKTWKHFENLFREQFGSQMYNSAGVWQPAIAPKSSRFLRLPFQTLLLYVSTEGSEQYPDELFVNQRYIFLWAPGAFGSATRIAQDKWIFMHYLPDGKLNAVPEQLTFQQMLKNLRTCATMFSAEKWPGENQTMDCHTLFKFLRLCYAAVLGISYALNSLVMILLDTLCFALIFRFFSSRQNDFLTFPELWKIGIYAAFPVFAAVTLLPTLQLPLAAYSQTVFMIGWMIYLLVILYSLRKMPEATSENGESNEKRR